ncbi:MAG: hypothetical protein L6R38_000043 [Xanthoria sp. 2 TBL-2021]|nr:MAG: hypothetical protein L6R38_000043 [Xanthoria sp. 2 TBL-2021]
MSEHSSLFRPTPRGQFELTPSSTEPPTPRTPSQESRGAGEPDSDPNGINFSDRTRSILNLTSSTLFGIYAPSGSPKDGSSTPWGTGSETPALKPLVDDNKPPIIGAYDKPHLHRRPSHPHVTMRNYYIPFVSRTILLFLFGVAYGTIVTHLHDNQNIAPVKVEGIDRHTWRYLAFWGVAGVLLGRLLPWIDIVWERTLGDKDDGVEPCAAPEDARSLEGSDDESGRLNRRFESLLGADWTPAIRSIGAFVGIAFAIRKLPWQSTLQVSLTLAMVNPALWYLIDRSKPGFLLSAMVGVAGTAVLLGINPSMVPAPPAPSPTAHAHPTANNISQHDSNLGVHLVSYETIAVSTWIASVLFCSSVCFGNIGRRLALDRTSRRGSLG